MRIRKEIIAADAFIFFCGFCACMPMASDVLIGDKSFGMYFGVIGIACALIIFIFANIETKDEELDK